ncbi:CmpA/NrtA family ABC transporter substrate-binding protein [Methylobacterium gregans]|uniref:Nitrate/nitrite binding protein NrtA n=2 Tax=Methylobacterium gregans TaxID=374424 RepID=A0AA37HR99_9HYPH|nr:CmpA/NrtA family ABC transporter substrate-binding protein [Methylobacterium gregans]MDQ0521604.1 NitT/TauT family transport system ATP-binding protein [Methylobacterium gregans]GJD80154.1 Nitrate/nitrite binding protein NrtA [Methylobacterium gregans]
MRLHIGYVPLCDAAPLIAAHAFGFARAEGLDLDLSPEPSWATLRDRLALGHLDAAQMLAPLALASGLGLSGPPADLAVPLGLNLNGNAVTVTNALWEAMAPEGDDLDAVARALGRVARARAETGRPLTLGTVHPFSCHTYQLRLLAERGGFDMARTRLVVVPPQHSVEALGRGLVDGFCAGAPWNGVAVAAGLGHVAALGRDLAPGAPEKVLAVSRRRDAATLPLVRAVARAGLWCAEPDNRAELAHCLARRNYLDIDAELIGRTLAGDLTVGAAPRRVPDYIRFGAEAQAPRPDHLRWLLAQMRAAGQVSADQDLEPAASALYRPNILAEALPGGAE